MIDKRFPNWDVNVKNGKVYSLLNNRYIGTIDKRNYCSVTQREKGDSKNYWVHRLIWMVANQCDIPEGYDVHHIDGNRQNNSIDNLELVEHKEHMSEHSSSMTIEHKKKLSLNSGVKRKVVQYTKEGELVKVWECAYDTNKYGFECGNICKCCQGKLKTHKGFKWKYLDNGTQYE